MEERNSKRYRHKQTEIQTYNLRQTYMRDKQKKETGRQRTRDRQTKRHSKRSAHKERDIYIERYTDKETDRGTDVGGKGGCGAEERMWGVRARSLKAGGGANPRRRQ